MTSYALGSDKTAQSLITVAEQRATETAAWQSSSAYFPSMAANLFQVPSSTIKPCLSPPHLQIC